MKLECFLREGIQIDIQPATTNRSWMDETLGRSAYRCLPLTIANSHGWTIHCPATFEAQWNGGVKPEDVEVFWDADTEPNVSGHFGSGILSFTPNAIFRTPPEFNLWITGPVNEFKDGIQPLSGVVETDWTPLPFSMNWKFTRPNSRVRFEKGEPYCFLFPLSRGLLEQFQPETRDLSSEPSLQEEYEHAHNRRSFPAVVKRLTGQDDDTHNWQKWYSRGSSPDGKDSIGSHQRKLRVKPFVRRTSDPGTENP